MTYEEYKQMNVEKEAGKDKTPSKSPSIPIEKNLEKLQSEDEKRKWREHQSNKPLTLSYQEFRELSEVNPIRNQSDEDHSKNMTEIGGYRHQRQQEREEIDREKKNELVRHYTKGYVVSNSIFLIRLCSKN